MTTALANARPAAKPSTNHMMRVDPQKLDAIEQIVSYTALSQMGSVGNFARAFQLAAGIMKLKELITDEVMREIMPLQGTALGFRTDKDFQGGYPVHVVKECLIEAVLRGAYPIGNEFNIIASRTYLTKEFFQRILGTLEGVTDIRAEPGIPKTIGESGALMPFKLSWKRNGVSECVDRTGDRAIPIRVNKQMGTDAIIGKATRKIYKQAYEQITGSAVSIPDGDIIEGEVVSAGNGRQLSAAAQSINKQLTDRPVSAGQTFVPDADATGQVERQNADAEEGAAELQAENDVQAATEALAEDPPQIDLYEEAVKNCDDRKKLLLAAAKEMGVSRADFEGWQFKYLNAKGTNLDSADTQTIADMLRAIKTGKAVWATGTINR